jgi:hypothetical protein
MVAATIWYSDFIALVYALVHFDSQSLEKFHTIEKIMLEKNNAGV